MSPLSLTDKKSTLTTEKETLLTKAGADKYIADKLAVIEPKLPALSSSMAWQCGIIVGRMKAEPAVVVAEEIQRLEARIVEVEKEIKPLDPIIRQVK